MRILPVLDLLNGVVVRGVGGRRSAYRPVVGRLADSAEPLVIAEAFRAHFGLDELYLADLDAIAGEAPALPVYRELLAHGFRLWIDAGIRDRQQAELLAEADAGIVAGLETLAGPAALADILAAHGDRVVFSLDLRAGEPLGDRTAWNGRDAAGIADHVVSLGSRRLLVLDLARVGTGSGTGTGTEALCVRLQSRYPDLELWTGGGIRDAADLNRLRSAGIHTVLVASALHDGSITGVDLSSSLRVR